MKKLLFIPAMILTACQPQAESRAHMEDTANRMSDSILKLIDSSLADPSHELKSIGYLYPGLERNH